MNNSRKKSSKFTPLGMENNNNGHNREFADSSEEEFQFNLGTHWKDLSNSLKTIGHQLQLSSEILKNAPLPSELQFLMHTGETKKINNYCNNFWQLEFLVLLFIEKKNKSLFRSFPRIDFGRIFTTRNRNGSLCNNFRCY